MRPKPLNQTSAYSFRMNYLQRGKNDCSMTLRGLKKTDASIYYFVYNFRKVTGDIVTCKGLPGVKLNIFTSPVSIRKRVSGQHVSVTNLTLMEGQRITLTCVPTCAYLNSNPGYIWYKNNLQLNGSANSCMSLDPISEEDMGSYVCAMIGYEDLPSRAVNLKVHKAPRNTVVSEIPDGGSQTDSVLTQTRGYDAQNSTDQIDNVYLEPKGKTMFTFSITLAAGVCVGWVIAVTVTILVIKVKKRKRRRCADSAPRPPNPNGDIYMALDIKSMSDEYDTLDTNRRSSAEDTIYENVCQPGNSLR